MKRRAYHKKGFSKNNPPQIFFDGFIDIGNLRNNEPWKIQELQLVASPNGLSDQAIAERLCRTVPAIRTMRQIIKKTQKIWAR